MRKYMWKRMITANMGLKEKYDMKRIVKENVAKASNKDFKLNAE